MQQRLFGLTLTDMRRVALQIAKRKGISHRFDKKKEMAGKSGWAPNSISVLCSRHFEESYFDRTGLVRLFAC